LFIGAFKTQVLDVVDCFEEINAALSHENKGISQVAGQHETRLVASLSRLVTDYSMWSSLDRDWAEASERPRMNGLQARAQRRA